MNTASAKPRGNFATIRVRLDDGQELGEYSLPLGSTLADLLRIANADTAGRAVLIDGKPPEEVLVLSAGSTVTLMPQSAHSHERPDWERAVGTFKDDAGFDEFVESVRRRRESELAGNEGS